MIVLEAVQFGTLLTKAQENGAIGCSTMTFRKYLSS